MAKRKKEESSAPVCALARMPCPETADPAKPVYCPCWVDAIPEVEKDGSGRVIAEHLYSGCYHRRAVLYQLSVTAASGQAAASADKAATEGAKCREAVQELVPNMLGALVAGAPLSLAEAPPGLLPGGHR